MGKFLSWGGGRNSTKPENAGLDRRAQQDIDRENDHRSYGSGRSWIRAKADLAQRGRGFSWTKYDKENGRGKKLWRFFPIRRRARYTSSLLTIRSGQSRRISS